MPSEQKKVMRVGLTAALTALTCIATIVLRIPVPATTGYFNLGDVFIVFAALWLGPIPGLVVGGVGSAMADAIGFPLFVPATLIVKGLEGLIIGVIAQREKVGNTWLHAVAAYGGAFVVVPGYFVFEAFVYPEVARYIPAFGITDVGAAIGEVAPNVAQWLVGATVGFGLWRAVQITKK